MQHASEADLDAQVETICDTLARTRPTAVNLFWAIDRMKRLYVGLRGRPLDEIRARLIRVRDEAVGAAARLGSLWRSGRLRAHGLARSEVLVYDLAALIYEARRDTALADTLATLEEETRQGSAEARALFRRMVEIHPAAPACLSGARDEPERGDLAAVRALQRALSIDSVADSVLVIRGLR